MAFAFCDAMINQYWMQGYLNMRGIIPPALLRDLRVEADKARNLAHELNGPQTQRIQPVENYQDRINLKPFLDYAQLPPLVDAVERLLGPGTRPATMSVLGILVEPILRPRLLGWHRDGMVEIPLAEQQTSPRRQQWEAKLHRQKSGNQVNCAIYPDSSLWYVPGSHLRAFDLPGERQEFCFHVQKNPYDQLEGYAHVELERIFHEACTSFPGAQRMDLNPGDYLIYRSSAWHNGLYLPYHPRATIHDVPSFA